MAYKFIREGRGVISAVDGLVITVPGSANWPLPQMDDGDLLVLHLTDGSLAGLVGASPEGEVWTVSERGLDWTDTIVPALGMEVTAVISAHALNSLIVATGTDLVLPDGFVQGFHLANGLIDRSKMGFNAVGRNQIEDLEVTEGKLGTDSVGARAMKEGVVVTSLMANGAVTLEKLHTSAQAAITADKANTDGSNLIGVAGWRGVLQVAEEDEGAEVPEEGAAGKSANTLMLKNAVDTLTNDLAQANGAIQLLRGELTNAEAARTRYQESVELLHSVTIAMLAQAENRGNSSALPPINPTRLLATTFLEGEVGDGSLPNSYTSLVVGPEDIPEGALYCQIILQGGGAGSYITNQDGSRITGKEGGASNVTTIVVADYTHSLDSSAVYLSGSAVSAGQSALAAGPPVPGRPGRSARSSWRSALFNTPRTLRAGMGGRGDINGWPGFVRINWFA